MVQHNNAPPGVHLPWAGKQVLLENVEAELSHLWRMSADNLRISQNVHVRTSVLNFVICAQNVESAQYASKLIRDLATTHIARVLLFILDTDSEAASGVSTWATLRSFPIISDLMRHSFEQVTVMASGNAVLATANIINTLLKPELPVYLWWLGDLPTDMDLFRRLTRTCSRVIVDSNSFFNPMESLEVLETFLGNAPNTALSDLSWDSITPWRELVAQFFDVSDYRSYLSGVHRIEIEHAIAPLDAGVQAERSTVSLNPACALLFAGWLKTSLNWQQAMHSSDDTYDPAQGIYIWHITRRTSTLLPNSAITGAEQMLVRSGEGSISIRPRIQANLPTGSLCLIRLVSAVDQHYATFTINRGEDGQHILTSVILDNVALPERTVSLPTTYDTVHMLHNELEIMGRDHLYEQALHAAHELLNAQ